MYSFPNLEMVRCSMSILYREPNLYYSPGVTKSWTRLSKGAHTYVNYISVLPKWLSWKRICLQCRRPSLITGLGRSTGEGIGYPLQYSWASLLAQLVKNPPAMWETWVRSLGWEDPLEKRKATLSSILAWRIPWAV